MICPNCRHGGDLNARRLTKLAKAAHDQCKGGTQCDCQHVVGRTARAGREPK